MHHRTRWKAGRRRRKNRGLARNGPGELHHAWRRPNGNFSARHRWWCREFCPSSRRVRGGRLPGCCLGHAGLWQLSAIERSDVPCLVRCLGRCLRRSFNCHRACCRTLDWRHGSAAIRKNASEPAFFDGPGGNLTRLRQPRRRFSEAVRRCALGTAQSRADDG